MSYSAKEIIKLLLPDLNAEPLLLPSEFIAKYWKQYESRFKQETDTENHGV